MLTLFFSLHQSVDRLAYFRETCQSADRQESDTQVCQGDDFLAETEWYTLSSAVQTLCFIIDNILFPLPPPPLHDSINYKRIISVIGNFDRGGRPPGRGG